MKKLIIILIALLISLTAAVGTYIAYVKLDGTEKADLTVHFIDVGQGDSCIVELPDDRKMLIDAGENKKEVREKLDDYVKQNIKDEQGKTITYFDIVILTHSDADHVGSMAYMLQNYGAKTVYRPNQVCTYNGCHDDAYDLEGKHTFWGDNLGSKSTATYHNVLEAAYERAEEVIVTNPHDDSQNKITSTDENEYEINFYSPISESYNDNNNYSPIVVITYMGRNIVLTGDAEKENEAEFVAEAKRGEGRYKVFDDFNADVIKLGHHGSRTSSSEEYLDTVTKSIYRANTLVVISCGKDNKYGHPHKEVLERLSNMGFAASNILRTDQKGDITVGVLNTNGQYKAVLLSTDGGRVETIKLTIIIGSVLIVVTVVVIVIKAKRKRAR